MRKNKSAGPLAGPVVSPGFLFWFVPEIPLFITGITVQVIIYRIL
jgi:hypothetical protein